MAMSTTKRHKPKLSILKKKWKKWDTTPHHSLCLGFLQLNPWLLKKKEKKKPSCILCHHTHEMGPSKNIFLSFQAISLIPDELQGRGKHYGCGLAGGKEGILWVVHECARLNVRMCVNRSLSEYICMTEKICLMATLFKKKCICL